MIIFLILIAYFFIFLLFYVHHPTTPTKKQDDSSCKNILSHFSPHAGFVPIHLDRRPNAGVIMNYNKQKYVIRYIKSHKKLERQLHGIENVNIIII